MALIQFSPSRFPQKAGRIIAAGMMKEVRREPAQGSINNIEKIR